eukprot:scaffold19595_cov65-Phaeocystis_antarctica.AAC.1
MTRARSRNLRGGRGELAGHASSEGPYAFITMVPAAASTAAKTQLLRGGRDELSLEYVVRTTLEFVLVLQYLPSRPR